MHLPEHISIHITLLDILGELALIFIYGLRTLLGKWMVKTTMRIMKWFYIRSEHDLAYYLHVKNQQASGKDKLL